MQRLFGEGSPWFSPWTERVLPTVERIVAHAPARTVFTRFIPPMHPEDRPGQWKTYYARWRDITRERLDLSLLDLFPALARYAPPATVIDKPTYSGFAGSTLNRWVEERQVDGLIVTGAETDVCILATVLGAVDRGLRVTIVTDAICSSSDPGHEALMNLYDTRFSEQVEAANAETILDTWRPA